MQVPALNEAQWVCWMCDYKATDLEKQLCCPVQDLVNKMAATPMQLLNQHIDAFQPFCILSN